MQVWHGPRLGSPRTGNCGCCGCLSYPNGDTVREFLDAGYPNDPVGKAYPRFTGPARLELEMQFERVEFVVKVGSSDTNMVCDWRDLNGVQTTYLPRSNFGCLYINPSGGGWARVFSWQNERWLGEPDTWGSQSWPGVGVLNYSVDIYRNERFRYVQHIMGSEASGLNPNWSVLFYTDPLYRIGDPPLPGNDFTAGRTDWGHDAKRLSGACTGTLSMAITLDQYLGRHPIGTFSSRIIRE